MQAIFEACQQQLDRLYADIERAIAGLSQEALDWTPGPEMNSFYALVVHLTGAGRYWIGDVAARESSGRDRAAEFRAEGLDEVALKQRLVETLTYCKSVVGKLALQDLETVHVSPNDGQQFTVAWSLLHALEHTAIHAGHIQIMRQMWDQKTLQQS